MSFEVTAASTRQINYTTARHLMRHVTATNAESRLTFNAIHGPHWLADGSGFWYEHQIAQGREYCLMDVHTATIQRAFNHEVLAKNLAAASEQKVEMYNLPIKELSLQLSTMSLNFSAFNQQWHFDGKHCVKTGNASPSANECVSPDGTRGVFEREGNLWLSCGESGDRHRQLTHDSEVDYAYGIVPNLVAARQELPGLSDLQVLWSPNSKQILTVQLDMRQVKSLPVVHHVPEDGSLRPQLEEYKYPLAGDTHMPEYRLVCIDIATGEITPAQYPPICSTFIVPFFTDGRAWWAPNSELAYFVDMKRGAQQVQVLEFNVHTGITRVLFEEKSSTWINLHPGNYHGPSLFKPLSDSGELIWYSERSGWAHLYLYDVETGELKNAITQGDWVVRELLRFDPERRELWIQTAGRVEGRDPYYKDICRVNIDSGELCTVVSSDHDYIVDNEASSLGLPEPRYGVSPDYNYVVATRTRADQAPTTLLFDRKGQEQMVIAETDVSRLPENWQWPEPVTLKAADGETDIYGLVFRPSHFSPDKSYPVIDSGFAYLSGTLVCKQFDVGQGYMYSAALAELGFIVVQLDGRGSPMRSRAFLDHGDGSLTSASDLSDHIAGLQQLAKRYPYMDLDRVGIFGGWTTSAIAINALLQYPEFYKVGVTSGMPQSQLYMALCSEPFEGPSHKQTDFVQPEHLAHKLEGKLLMIHGMLDILDVPAATFRMVEAFQKANKDFDLLLLPNQKHGSGWANPYIARRILDFFVRHLLGEEPPKDFDLREPEEH